MSHQEADQGVVEERARTREVERGLLEPIWRLASRPALRRVEACMRFGRRTIFAVGLIKPVQDGIEMLRFCD